LKYVDESGRPTTAYYQAALSW